jgi:2-dehydropantoate 2-reductase
MHNSARLELAAGAPGLTQEALVAVAGAGSVGCYIGGCLALEGRRVAFLARPELADAIARHGLCISSLDSGDRAFAPWAIRPAVDPAEAFAQADVILVTVKSGATEEMADLIARHAPPDAMVVSLQNGVGNVHTLRRQLGDERVVGGMVPFNVVQTQEASGRPYFHRATSGTLLVEAGIPGLRTLLDVPGVRVREHSDMPAVQWGKLLLNLNNGLNALSGLPLATQLADRNWRLLLAEAIEEALAVFKAIGIRPARIESVSPRLIPFILRLPDGVFRLVARRMLAVDPQARSSMWEDLERRRATEINYLQGAIVTMASKLGVPAPINARITEFVLLAEAAGAGSPRLTPTQIAGQEA